MTTPVSGHARWTPQHVRPGPRDRLIDAATELTYSHGATVGIDAILKRADVARRSLYQHFGGKDGLIAEVIRASAAASEFRYEQALEAGGQDPRRRLLSVFDAVESITAEPDFRGCRYIKADLMLTDPAHPAHVIIREHKRRVRDLLEAELQAMSHPKAETAAIQLQLLIDGVLIVAATRPEDDAPEAARMLAEHVVGTTQT